MLPMSIPVLEAMAAEAVEVMSIECIPVDMAVIMAVAVVVAIVDMSMWSMADQSRCPVFFPRSSLAVLRSRDSSLNGDSLIAQCSLPFLQKLQSTRGLYSLSLPSLCTAPDIWGRMSQCSRENVQYTVTQKVRRAARCDDEKGMMDPGQKWGIT